MPHFFFHVHDGRDQIDHHGAELAGLAAARREAVRYTGALLSSEPDTFWAADEWKVRVTDALDLTLFELTVFATNSPASM